MEGLTRYNVAAQITDMADLREQFIGADRLNWLIPYSVSAYTEDDEVSFDLVGSTRADGERVVGQFEGYAMMPRVRGVAHVEVIVETPEDAHFIATAVKETQSQIAASSGEAITALPFLATRMVAA